MKKMGKKGMFALGDLPRVALIFLLVGVVFALALVILASFGSNSNITSNADASAAVNASIDAVSEIPTNWLGLIAVIVAASLVITIAVVGLMNAMGGIGGGRR